MIKISVIIAILILSISIFLNNYLKPFDQHPVLKQEETYDVAIKVEEVARDLFVPWSIVFTSKDRMLVTERDGKVREIVNGKLNSKPLAVFNVSAQAEEGLMGMDIDPNYEKNKKIYLCLAYDKSGALVNKVISATDKGDEIIEDKTLIDDIESARWHAGCRVKFGPDKKLYVSTGDASKRDLVQNLNSLSGKILRLNPDGTIPADNPFPDSYVYSLGHRNIQGFDWSSDGNLYAIDHGPSGFDGPGGGDELNLILKGENYGWPKVSHEESLPEYKDPLTIWTPAIAPASLTFYTSNILPQFKNTVLVGMLRGEGILYIEFENVKKGIIKKQHKISGISYGRIREVIEGPDNNLYFTTSNKDGRGDSVGQNDDKIYRLTFNKK
jgi:glucose/arabinose dehydrogenase